jgi:hypothetical protein
VYLPSENGISWFLGVSESKTGKNQEIGFELVLGALPLMGAAALVSFLFPGHRRPSPFCSAATTSSVLFAAGLPYNRTSRFWCWLFALAVWVVQSLDIDAAPWLGRCAAVG